MKVDPKIINHVLMPKHEKLSDRQKQEILKTYNITEGQLPKIKIKDAGLMGLDVKRGDVIRITRKTRTAGTSYFYRVVTDV